MRAGGRAVHGPSRSLEPGPTALRAPRSDGTDADAHLAAPAGRCVCPPERRERRTVEAEVEAEVEVEVEHAI